MSSEKNLQVDAKTIEDFGAQWTTYTGNEGYYGSTKLLADLLEPLLPVEEIKGKYLAEIGSGSGRIVNMLMEAGAGKVLALEPSDAMGPLRENTAKFADQLTYVQAPGHELPVDNYDYVLSIGVIHHITEPSDIIARSYEALKPGGKMLVWLYGREGNELYLSFAEPLRKVTKVLPDWLLAVTSHILNVFLWVYMTACVVLPLPMRDYMLNHIRKLGWHKRFITIFDQLNPCYAKYYYKAEAEALLKTAGFQNVQIYHRHGYSWTVVGEKPAP